MLQPPGPLHAPPQPAKLELESGTALNDTPDPDGAVMLHVPGQSIPAGDEVTRPDPLPVNGNATVMRPVGGGPDVEKVAVTSRSVSIVRVQSPVPEHSPCQPAKVDPGAGTARSWTLALAAMFSVHCAPQSKAGLDECTLSKPLPPVRMVTACVDEPPDPAPAGPVPG